MKVRAKFLCNSKMDLPDGGVTVWMSPVYSSDPASENKAFCDATPAGVLQMQISKGKPAADVFVQGKQYYVDILPV
jgi:hypothetical protein